MTHATWFVTLTFCVLLAGCSFVSPGPPYQRPEVSLPNRWATQTKPVTHDSGAVSIVEHDREDAKGWSLFEDRLLEGLIEQAIQNNLNLKMAQARLMQSRANRSATAALEWPEISASVGASKLKNSQAEALQKQDTLYDAGFDAQWEIDLFGAKGLGLEAANADVAAQEAQLKDVRVSIVAEVNRNYIELRQLQQRMLLANEHLNIQSQTLDLAQWRLQAGLARATEVEQARNLVEQTRAAMHSLQDQLITAENRLAVLLGLYPGQLHDCLKEVKSMPNLPDQLATGIPADVLLRRPDLVAAERALAAETARTQQKKAQRYPGLMLTGSLGWQAYSLGALGNAGTWMRSVGVSLATNLFDAGRLKHEIQAQSAAQEQALIYYQMTVLQALEEVENALKSVAANQDRLVSLGVADQSASRAAVLTLQLYQSGLVDFQSVLETQRSRLMIQDTLVIAEAALRIQLVALYKALGGGWTGHESEELS